ncbi:IS66 family insertion sequence element accessory protein TnpB [Alteromonas sp. 345S023]|uniref:IS66 family insertion sequence element accessory protein TnpB n=1 Tax=Alteromonas profundi TaxID=2696062 RepID=A0A7X5RMI9_9ALTE|nr:IS66 family insertion sequence element accessory protein TnpB [Alteromonas profundi]NDV93153.1 IS66 family insertion sequence element accessory protein TnpB [Alteromonas profundi]
MKMFVEPADIYLYMDIVDFRKSINGLIVVVEQQMQLSPFRDALFVFCNKKRDKLKILYWDKTGFALWYKRLGATRSRFVYC